MVRTQKRAPSALFALLPLALAAGASTGLARSADPGGAAVEWLESSLDEALARAAAEDTYLMVELVTDWELDCERLRKTLEHEDVAARLAELLCLRIDAERGEGALLAFRQRIGSYPTLLFLEPDGAVRERLHGYLSPQLMVAQLERIARNEDTLKALREAVEASPEDLEARYAYALKLKAAGDVAGNAEQLAEISRLDPEGTSPVSLRIGFDEIHDTFFQDMVDWKEPDWEALTLAIESVDDPVLEHKGISMLAYAHHIEGIRARNRGELEDVQPHLTESRALYRQSWELVPDELVAVYGNELAWNFWKDAENLTDEEKAFALEVGELALERMPDSSSILDTVACCRFMNGQVEEALELVERCRELDPERSKQWDQRVKEFTAEPAEATGSAAATGAAGSRARR